MLVAIAEAFETEIVSEYDPQYWGYYNEVEWNYYDYEAVTKREEEDLYADVIGYVLGWKAKYHGNCNEDRLRKLEIGERLIERDPIRMDTATGEFTLNWWARFKRKDVLACGRLR